MEEANLTITHQYLTSADIAEEARQEEQIHRLLWEIFSQVRE